MNKQIPEARVYLNYDSSIEQVIVLFLIFRLIVVFIFRPEFCKEFLNYKVCWMVNCRFIHGTKYQKAIYESENVLSKEHRVLGTVSHMRLFI